MANTQEPITDNARDLQRELDWLAQMISARLARARGDSNSAQDPGAIPAVDLAESDSSYARFLNHYQLNRAERIAFLLALAPHLRPLMLNVLQSGPGAATQGTGEQGGVMGTLERGLLPTGETVLWLLAGANLADRLSAQRLFDRDHIFAHHQIVTLGAAPEGEPHTRGAWALNPDILDYVTVGEMRKPTFSMNFPAKHITTEMDWDDLVLAPATRQQLNDIYLWEKHQRTLREDWGLNKKLRPGYRALFYGPPGTGKTMTATLLGKQLKKDVYKVDLATVVSKYIGETEKNLEKVFQTAANKNWILFFDEADALFGQRTKTKDAHDRYGNQEIAYLLQRIEDFNGLTILATNKKENIDEAFLRRFESVVHFPKPKAAERKLMWEQGMPKAVTLDDGIKLNELGEKHEITGATISNVIRASALQAIARQRTTITYDDLRTGLRQEYQKEEKTL